MSTFHRLVRNRWSIAIAVASVLAIAVLIPLPYPSSQSDREAAVIEALDALLKDGLVETPSAREKLQETSFVTEDRTRIYFVNMIDVPDSIFLNAGLKPVPSGSKVDIDNGDKLVEFSYQDVRGNLTTNMQFSYIFGNLGAHGYEISIRKCLRTRQIVFIHTWIS
jgi:hypothetical protein